MNEMRFVHAWPGSKPHTYIAAKEKGEKNPYVQGVLLLIPTYLYHQ
jgi:hypothetical protein